MLLNFFNNATNSLIYYLFNSLWLLFYSAHFSFLEFLFVFKHLQLMFSYLFVKLTLSKNIIYISYTSCSQLFVQSGLINKQFLFTYNLHSYSGISWVLFLFFPSSHVSHLTFLIQDYNFLFPYFLFQIGILNPLSYYNYFYIFLILSFDFFRPVLCFCSH